MSRSVSFSYVFDEYLVYFLDVKRGARTLGVLNRRTGFLLLLSGREEGGGRGACSAR